MKFVYFSLFKKGNIPGPGGLMVEFYLGFYDFLKEDLMKAVQESKISRKVLGVMTSTFIALISKKQDVDSFEDFRPISLCNLVYKHIYKTIANR